MIDTSELLSFSGIVSELGDSEFNLSRSAGNINLINEDVKREEYAYSILKRYKMLTGLKSALSTCDEQFDSNSFDSLADVNAKLFALAISKLSDENKMNSMKMYLIDLMHSKKYDTSKIKSDCQILMSADTPQSLTDDIMKRALLSEMNLTDLTRVFERHPELFTKIGLDDCARISAQIDQQINDVNIKQVLDAIFAVCKKRALSVFITTRDDDAAIKIYTDCFDKILSYVKTDITEYIEKASDSLVEIEEVVL